MKKNITILPILVAVLIASISSCHSQKARQESEQQKSLKYEYKWTEYRKSEGEIIKIIRI